MTVGQVLFQTGAPLALVNFFATGIGGSLLVAAGGLAASYVGSALLRPPLPPGIKPSDGQVQLRQGLEPRRKSYGRVRVSGPVNWFATPDAAPSGLFVGIAINHGRIGGYVSFHIDENQVTLDGSDVVLTPTFYTGDDPVTLHHHLGLPTETPYPEILPYFGIDQVRGDGIASILGIFDDQATSELQQKVYTGGFPKIRATIDATVCFDPRNSAHIRSDPSTWTSSNNPVVHILEHVTSKDGFAVDYDTRILPNLAQWVAAMNACDVLVPVKGGGTTVRYKSAGTFQLNELPVNPLRRILAACDGRLWQRRDGTIGISVGVYAVPTVVLKNEQITGFQFDHGQDSLTSIAGLRATYMEPSADYKEQEAEAWPTGEIVAELSEDRVDTLDLNFVPVHSQARRLLKREFLRRTSPWRGQIITTLAGLRAIDERFITVQIDLLQINQSFEISKFAIDPENLRCVLDVTAVGPEIDVYDAETEDGDTAAAASAVFSLRNNFSKTGTAIDPIVEGGGVAGDRAIVFVASKDAAGVAATPAGWSLIAPPAPAVFAGLTFAAYTRKLDGTETSTTFLAGAGGGIAQINIQKAAAISWIENDWIDTAIPPVQFISHDSPVAYFAFGAISTQDSSNWLELGDRYDIGTDLADMVVIWAIAGGPTLHIRAALYRDYEIAPSAYGKFFADKGTNGLMTIAVVPEL